MNPLIFVVFYVLFLLVLFLSTRFFWLWYFKIDKAVKILEDIRWNLEQINKDQPDNARKIVAALKELSEGNPRNTLSEE